MLVPDLIAALESRSNLHLPAYFQQMAPLETAHPIYGLEKVYLWPDNSVYSDRFLDERRLKVRERSFRESGRTADVADFRPAYIFNHHVWDDNYVGGKPELTGRGLLDLLRACEPALEVFRPYLSDDRYGLISSVGVYTTNKVRGDRRYCPLDTKFGSYYEPDEWRQILVVQ
jgi:hypothetical protein